jgi:hypothetical protein
MRAHPTILIAGLLVFGALTRTAATTAQAPAPPAGSATMTIDAVAHRIMQAEAALTVRMKVFRPIVEVYVQHVETHESLGSVPVRDDYFLGQFEWIDPVGAKMTRLIPERDGRRQVADWLARPFGLQLNFDGFATMTVPDWRLLSSQHHAFTYLRREFLGEVRCLVLDVAPRVDSRDGFTGRIWIEERDFNIVRFNGTTRSPRSGKPLWFNVDSWRANVIPGLWLPSYVYSELQNDEGPRIKSHVRLWGYFQTSDRSPKVTTTGVGDRRAIDDVLERLSRVGLLAPPGEVDKVLSTVITNLQITNNLNLEPVKTRVLLTSPLQSFTVGRTVVLSRGLIDVLPDEASLATMLAHELAHIVLGHRAVDPAVAVAGTLTAADEALLATAVPRYTPEDEAAADQRAVELLKNSPYRDKLANTGLFLRALSENSKRLTHLIQLHVGESTGKPGQVRRLTEIVEQSPALSAERADQVAALPLGGRVVVDPWTGGVQLMRTGNVPPASAREKSPLAVTPLVPYLRYAEARTVTPE